MLLGWIVLRSRLTILPRVLVVLAVSSILPKSHELWREGIDLARIGWLRSACFLPIGTVRPQERSPSSGLTGTILATLGGVRQVCVVVCWRSVARQRYVVESCVTR